MDSGLITHRSIKSEPPGAGPGALVVIEDSQVTLVCHQGWGTGIELKWLGDNHLLSIRYAGNALPPTVKVAVPL